MELPTRTNTDPSVHALTGLHRYHATLSNSSMRVRLLLEEHFPDPRLAPVEESERSG